MLVGFEQTPECWLRGRKRTADATGVTLTGMSARQALDRLMALMPEYSWREMDGVAVVRPAAKWEDPADVLNFPASAFSLTGDANDALHEALQAVTPPVFFPHVDDQQSIEGPVPFVFPGGTLLDALNAIVRAHRGAGWQLGYQGNRGTIRLDTFVFDSGAVMAPILLPRSPVVPLLLTGAGIQGPSPRGVSPATAGPSVIYWPGAGPARSQEPNRGGPPLHA